MTEAHPLHWPEHKRRTVPGRRDHHPDNGGSAERMAEINAAIAAARKEKKQ